MPTLPRRSQKLKQCQHCFKSENEVPLKCCRDCRRAHYCSTECQKAEWKAHKPECITMKQNLETMKHQLGMTGIPLADAEKVSKTWVQIFRPHLSVTVLHALEIQRDPNRVLTHILHLTISPNFTKDTIPKKTSDIRTAFKFEDALIASVQDTLEVLPAYKPQIEMLLARSRDERKQNAKAIGYPLVMLIIPQCQIARVIPLGIEEDPGVSWDPEWKVRLAHNMAQGFCG